MRIMLLKLFLRAKFPVFHYPCNINSQLKLLEYNLTNTVTSIFTRTMSQKSITSFFKVTPKNPKSSKEEKDVKKKPPKKLMLYSSDTDDEEMGEASPYTIKKYGGKRRRIDSSGSEESLESGSETPCVKMDITSHIKTYESPKSKKEKLHKNIKRSRIVDSEESSQSGSEMAHVKVENIKTYESPKSKKAKVSDMITPLYLKNEKSEPNSPTAEDKKQIGEPSSHTQLDINEIDNASSPTQVDHLENGEPNSPTMVEKDIIHEPNEDKIHIPNNVENDELNSATANNDKIDEPSCSTIDEMCETGGAKIVYEDEIDEPCSSINVGNDEICVTYSPSNMDTDIICETEVCVPDITNNAKAESGQKPAESRTGEANSPIVVYEDEDTDELDDYLEDDLADDLADYIEDDIDKPSSSNDTGKTFENNTSAKEKKNANCKASCSSDDEKYNISEASSPATVDQDELSEPESPANIKKEAVTPPSKKITKKEKIEDIVVTPVPEREYDPGKKKYNPVSDACWARGAPVPYIALARTLAAIEATSSRIQMAEILANYFRSVMVLTPQDLVPSIYMCLNQLAPAFHGLELGVAETYLMRAVGACTGMTVAQVRALARRMGDLGAAAGAARRTQRCVRQPPPLVARHVFHTLRDIARMAGQASVNKKIARIQSLFTACRDCEGKFLIRSLEGKLRIGLAEQTLLQALGVAVTMTPPGPDGITTLDATKGLSRQQIKERVDANALTIRTTYCECPDYEKVVPALLQYGVTGLPLHCPLKPGVPLKPMLAHPARAVSEALRRFESEKFTCEFKYDGERAQIHVPEAEGGGTDLAKAGIFSRNQENNTSKFPDVLGRLPSFLKDSVTSCVLDCEVVAFDPETKQILPFQVLSTRKRKDAAADGGAVKVCVYAFDLLYLNGAPLVRRPFEERRALLHDHFTAVPGEWQFATGRDCTDVEEVQEFLEESVQGGCEGLMVKALQGSRAKYDIARRSRNWLKLKKDYLEGGGDSVDVVVIGAYLGKGRRAGCYGGFLLACYDPSGDEYQTLCKLGTGFGDEQLREFSEALRPHAIEYPKSYYRYDPALKPDVWLAPSQVWEVRGADVSLSQSHRAAQGLPLADRGLSLRFPRFVRVREDKTPEEATTAQQLLDMYIGQIPIKNMSRRHDPADDFY